MNSIDNTNGCMMEQVHAVDNAVDFLSGDDNGKQARIPSCFDDGNGEGKEETCP